MRIGAAVQGIGTSRYKIAVLDIMDIRWRMFVPRVVISEVPVARDEMHEASTMPPSTISPIECPRK